MAVMVFAISEPEAQASTTTVVVRTIEPIVFAGFAGPVATVLVFGIVGTVVWVRVSTRIAVGRSTWLLLTPLWGSRAVHVVASWRRSPTIRLLWSWWRRSVRARSWRRRVGFTSSHRRVSSWFRILIPRRLAIVNLSIGTSTRLGIMWHQAATPLIDFCHASWTTGRGILSTLN